MMLTNEISMVKSASNGVLRVETPKGVKHYSFGDKEYNRLYEIYCMARSCPNSQNRLSYMASHQDILDELNRLLDNFPNKIAVEDIPTPVKIEPEKQVKAGLKNMLNFFKEFEFEPNFRFVNSLAIALQDCEKTANEYVINYFKLVDSIYVKEITQKVKSPEWKDICKDISAIVPKNPINTRFKVYYGSAGTGKTTLAQQETAGRCVICNNSMLPADLMEDFIFENGQPSFRPSMLWECMEKGLPITLDEINLLPFEALRFLQGILDGKKEFVYKGNLVHIADGFQVIGTMNLIVNGAVFNLPEPLVDRASVMKEFKLTATQLLNAIV